MATTHETPTITNRRATISAAAVTAFARKGYYATTVADVATASGYSSAYVFRLFTDKLGLFVAAIERCNRRIEATLKGAADAAAGASSADVLDAMGGAYAELIADHDLLMLQVHAQSACAIPEVRTAVRGGYARVVDLLRERTDADDDEIQSFIARGLLCHLVVTMDIDGLDAPWASVLTKGLRHPGSAQEVDAMET